MEEEDMNTETPVEKPLTGDEPNLLQKVIGVFISPAQTFAKIAANPTWIAPLVIISIVNLVFIYVAGDVILNETLQQQEMKLVERGADQEQIDQTVEATEKFMSGPFMKVWGVVVPMIILAIIAAVMMFVGNVILGGSATFKKVFAVTGWSWLILSLYGLIILPLVLTKETMQVNFSLATFISDESRNTFLYQLLAKMDLFYIWWIAVYSIGLAAIYKMKTQKVAAAVAAVYAVYAVAAAALSGLFS
jgi:hypothetical protein